jgi:glycosyltransferase involved in cell wall biosynthesis
MKLLVFSICHNEAGTIGELIDRIPREIEGVDELSIFVIDDGSTDATAEIAESHGATVVRGESQMRLARRFEQAVELALAEGADLAANIDGDLQFTPEELPQVIAPIIEGRADFVAGDRFTHDKSKRCPKGMPRGKYLANRFGAAVVSNLSDGTFTDVTCGYRAYSRRALLSLNINSEYTYTQESFQLLARKRLAIETVPISVKYYEGRKSRVVTSFWGFIFNSGLNILRAFRDFAPLRFFVLLGLLPLVVGGAFGTFVLVHWIRAGAISPYKSIGILGIYMVSLGLVAWLLGLVADMLDRTNKNQEKILQRLKLLQHPLSPGGLDGPAEK